MSYYDRKYWCLIMCKLPYLMDYFSGKWGMCGNSYCKYHCVGVIVGLILSSFPINHISVN
jgi:hypothetical protein